MFPHSRAGRQPVFCRSRNRRPAFGSTQSVRHRRSANQAACTNELFNRDALRERSDNTWLVSGSFASAMEYTSAQVHTIEIAIQRGREAMQQSKRFDALVFARAFIDHGGVQIPSQPDNETKREQIAAQLIAALESGRSTSADPTLARELRRAHAEAHWASAAESDKVVGFHLKLGPAATLQGVCRELLTRDYGLGAGVFPKGRIMVLPPACDDHEFTPLLEDEVEQ